MSGDATVCGIIPAYNAEATIADVVKAVLRHLETVLVADDGSTDGTARVAEAAGAAVILLEGNRGKGQALRALFAEARRRGFAAVVAIDADGQHDAEDIPAFLRLHRERPEGVISGSRMADPSAIPRHRHNSMLVARYFVSLAANQFIDDTQCGFRLYPLAVIDSMALLKERYVTETEILIKAGDSGGEIISLPIRPRYRPGQPTHFRSVPDVAAISVYVISYLMVKWAIEGVRPGTSRTYRGPGAGRDRFCRSPRWDRAFEVFTLLAALPLSLLYSLWYLLTHACAVPTFHSLTAGEIPVARLLLSIMLLPVLMLRSIGDLIGNRLGLHPDLSTDFIHRHYLNPWQR